MVDEPFETGIAIFFILVSRPILPLKLDAMAKSLERLETAGMINHL